MNNRERWEYYESGELQRGVAVKLIDWVGYWTNAGLDSITSEVKKHQMRQVIYDVLHDISMPIKIVSTIAMSYPAIKDAVLPTDQNISQTVDDILTNRLDWVTNILQSDYEENE